MAHTPELVNEFQQSLGMHVRRLRLAKNLSVEAVAESTQLAEKSVRNLESGRGSTTETLFKVLTAVNARKLLRMLTPPAAATPDGTAGAPSRQRAGRGQPKAPK